MSTSVIFRFRQLSKTTFLILQDCTGLVQCVCAPELLKDLHLKLDDVVEIHGNARADSRSTILGLSNVRQTTMYPRDRYHIAP
jgi:aspartyl/asparaginyl-tRNA synthetase